jgi:hypothetical protein
MRNRHDGSIENLSSNLNEQGPVASLRYDLETEILRGEPMFFSTEKWAETRHLVSIFRFH